MDVVDEAITSTGTSDIGRLPDSAAGPAGIDVGRSGAVVCVGLNGAKHSGEAPVAVDRVGATGAVSRSLPKTFGLVAVVVVPGGAASVAIAELRSAPNVGATVADVATDVEVVDRNGPNANGLASLGGPGLDSMSPSLVSLYGDHHRRRPFGLSVQSLLGSLRNT